MCKWIELGPRNRLLGAVTEWWPVARQEQLLRAAGMRSLLPLGDADGDEPINYECDECGGAGADCLFGIAEGLRPSWFAVPTLQRRPLPTDNSHRHRPIPRAGP
ncbi:hypothetical protein GCM10017774_78540 [Lentzea cavernae]|uniref:Uncharacterized protein n=1 Tax=Lentzea cavernae TaxID=2020703 RepID=A0ABQ3MSX5_9PSEU|nr:hypothetical protein GCM10017774_78540 [Lentzea cavernae]